MNSNNPFRSLVKPSSSNNPFDEDVKPKSSSSRRPHRSDRSRSEKDKDGKRSEKKSSRHRHHKHKKEGAPLDTVDKLDVTGFFTGGTFHHDGPFDACTPHRNKNQVKAPVNAFPIDGPNTSLKGGLDVTEDPVAIAIHGTDNSGGSFLEGSVAAQSVVIDDAKQAFKRQELGRKKSIARFISRKDHSAPPPPPPPRINYKEMSRGKSSERRSFSDDDSWDGSDDDVDRGERLRTTTSYGNTIESNHRKPPVPPQAQSLLGRMKTMKAGSGKRLL